MAVSGYISFLSTERHSKAGNKYFEIIITTQDEEKRIVCRDRDRYVIFEKIMASAKGCFLNKLSLADDGTIFFNTHSTVI